MTMKKNTKKSTQEINVGIDVGKAQLDFFFMKLNATSPLKIIQVESAKRSLV